MLGADDFSGYPKKATETNDQAVGQMHDFGACKYEDGKCVLDNEITKQANSLKGSSEGTASPPDLTIPGGLDQKDAKTNAGMAPAAADPTFDGANRGAVK